MRLTREECLNLAWENPIELGRWVGFRDLTEMNNEWLKMFLFSEEDITLQAHRGSYKTTTLSVFFAWHTIIKPNERLMYFRKTTDDVAEIARQTLKILQSPCTMAIVNAIYGKDLVLCKATNNEIQTNLTTVVKGSSQIFGIGIGSSITGKHADIIVTDDIVNINDRIYNAERNRTKLAYQELQNIKNRGGRFINAGTPWHKDDAFTLMPNIHKYDCYSTGLMTAQEVEDVRRKMLPSLFAANYELKHISDDDVIFPNPQVGFDVSLAEQGDSHIDAAYDGEDYTAFTVVKKRSVSVGKDAEGNDIFADKYYVFGKLWRKHIDDVEEEILSYHHALNSGKIYVEDNADKGYLVKELRSRGERCVRYHEDMNKFLKITSYLKKEWENICFVVGTDEEYINMIVSYSENAEHDDAPDSLASLIRKKWGEKTAENGYKSIIGLDG